MTLEKKKTNIFFIMPLNKEKYPKSLEFFERLKERFEGEYEFKHANSDNNNRNIMEDVMQGLEKADVVIADLSTINSNVFYELGVAHTLNKKVICVIQATEYKDLNEKLPFDIDHYKVYKYESSMDLPPCDFYRDMKKKEQEGVDVDAILEKHWSDFSSLCKKLEEHLKEVLNGKSKFGNPVSKNFEHIEWLFCDMIFNKKQLENKADWDDFNKLIECMVQRQSYNHLKFVIKINESRISELDLGGYLGGALNMIEYAHHVYEFRRDKEKEGGSQYISKTLKNWYERGYKEPEDAGRMYRGVEKMKESRGYGLKREPGC